MKKLFLLLLAPMFIVDFGYVTTAQTMHTYQSDDFNVQFQIPADWSTISMTDLEVPYLESTSPDENLHLLIYVSKDPKITADQLLDREAKSLGFVLKGLKQERINNGIHTLKAEGKGAMMGEKIHLLFLSFTSDAFAYFAYAYSNESLFTVNEKMMNKILDSIHPLK